MSTEHKYEEFLTWVERQGVKFHSVHLSKIPNQGLGIVASRNIEKDESLVFIPARALISFDSERLQSLDLDEDATVHGKLATCLTLWGDLTHLREWHAVWPNMEDFQSMPLVWPESLQGFLPPAAKAQNRRCTLKPSPREEKYPRNQMLCAPALPKMDSGNKIEHTKLNTLLPIIINAFLTTLPFFIELLNKQNAKFKADWKVASDILGTTPTSREAFLYYWLIVNTRTFYWDSPGWKKRKLHRVKPPISKSDRMALCPFGDCFNHADQGCNVTFNAKGFTITSDRTYEAGEELYVSYGAHSNDFLLTEYGFMLDSNKHDVVTLDTFLLPLLEPHRNLLENAFFYGNYTLLPTGESCFRTQAALRLLIDPPLSSAKWQRFADGLDDGDAEQSKVDSYLRDLLSKYLEEVKRTQDAVAAETDVSQMAKELLGKRWRQIVEIVGRGVERLEGRE